MYLKTRFLQRITTGGHLAYLSRPPVVIWIPTLILAAVILLSPTYLLLRSFGTDLSTWELLLRSRILMVLLRTLFLVGTVTIVSCLIAIPIAWLQVRTDLRFRKFWSVIPLLPLVMPSYVGGFIFIVALGTKGMLQTLLNALWGFD